MKNEMKYNKFSRPAPLVVMQYGRTQYNRHHMIFTSKIICKLFLDVEENRYKLD